MDANKMARGVRRLMAVPVLGISGNFLGAGITFIWFSLLQPGLVGGRDAGAFHDRAIFFALLMATLVAVVVPINARWFWPLVREFKRLGEQHGQGDPGSVGRQRLSALAGKLLHLPVRLSATCLGAWIVAGLVFALVPHTFPDYCPWDATMAMKIASWTVFLGAPITVLAIYFLLESWLRKTIEEAFPWEALRSRPSAARIGVLARMLVVSLVIGTMPAIVISHITLHQIHEIKVGNQSIDGFLFQMPLAIGFLLALSVTVVVCLSVFLAKSISEPLRKARSAMESIEKGELHATIPVLSNDEIGIMSEGFNRMAEGLRERDYILETFGRYLSEEVVAEILQSPEGVKLGGELRNITILVSDLRGFTPIAESLEPQSVLEVLNRYFESMTDVIVRHRGTIDEFTGDGILVFFGAPRPAADHAGRAVACALDMQQALKAVNRENLHLGRPELRMGIGINSGELIVGNIGSEKRRKYGAVGSPINVAFRVETHAAGGEILLTPSVYEQVADRLKVNGTTEAHLKGFEKPMTLYSVLAMM